MLKEMFDLTGKTALVTGSNRGIGKAILYVLAEAGADVVLHCRKECESALYVMNDINKNGRSCSAVYADLADPDAADVIASTVQPDILVINASVQIRRDFFEITDEDLDVQVNVDLRSTIKLIQLLSPRMLENRSGRIILIGSVQEKKPHPEMAVYSALKSAMSNLVAGLSVKFAPYGVTVNNIAPGTILTDRNTEVLADPEYERRVRSMIPIGFIGEPRDISGCALLLASDAGRYITGQNIYIDGGKSAQ